MAGMFDGFFYIRTHTTHYYHMIVVIFKNVLLTEVILQSLREKFHQELKIEKHFIGWIFENGVYAIWIDVTCMHSHQMIQDKTTVAKQILKEEGFSTNPLICYYSS